MAHFSQHVFVCEKEKFSCFMFLLIFLPFHPSKKLEKKSKKQI